MLWADFLENTAPNTAHQIDDLLKLSTDSKAELKGSDIQLHCWSDTCNGKRIFEISIRPRIENRYWQDETITYV